MAEVLGSTALSRRNWNRQDRIRRRVLAVQQRLLTQIGSPARVTEQMVLVALQGQRAVVAAADGYMSLSAGLATGSSTTPLGVNPEPLIGRAARNGRFLEDVYGPIVQIARNDYARGVALMRQQIVTDMSLAHRQSVHASTSADRRITGYRRQINPGGGETCGLCIAASTRRYSKQELNPLHPMCRCTVVPIMSTDPFGDGVIDEDALAAVYARAESTQPEDLARLRFSLDEIPDTEVRRAIAELEPRIAWHPEIGPYLQGRNHSSVFDTAVGATLAA
jgi:hypothetical protein